MKPNLFIIGAPKCGTSSLFDWLAGHPDIRGSRVKEPFFLTDPDHPLSRRPNLAEDGMAAYGEFFQPEDADAPIRMEATTHYLFDSCAREAIADMAEAKVIVVLREPAKRVYSSFQYTGNNLARLSQNLTFKRYINMIEAGERLTPEWCNHEGSAFVLERDLEYSRYANHLEPWLKSIGSNRIKILIMEKMVRDPDATVRDVLSWLELDSSRIGVIDRAARNRTEQVRTPWLQSLVRWMNSRVRLPRTTRLLIKRAYGAFQFRKPAAMPDDDDMAMRHLKAKYASDNEELARISGLDLSIWSSDSKVAGVSNSQ